MYFFFLIVNSHGTVVQQNGPWIWISWLAGAQDFAWISSLLPESKDMHVMSKLAISVNVSMNIVSLLPVQVVLYSNRL